MPSTPANVNKPGTSAFWWRWSKWCLGAAVGADRTYYPKAGNGRPPYLLEAMLRIHLLQIWFTLSDPAIEEAPYEITSLRQFANLSLTQGSIPEGTTIINFRHRWSGTV